MIVSRFLVFAWIAWVLFWLLATAGLVYVAVHFILKHW